MRPIGFIWDGTAMTPLMRFNEDCAKRFERGFRYWLVEAADERSPQSHSHYFAALREAWRNMPESLTEEYPSAEHLRHKALIKCGYYNEEVTVLDTQKDALLFAQVCDKADTFSLVAVSGKTVRIWHAKSQSKRSMGKQEFEASKQAVLDWIAALVGTPLDDLVRNADRAA